RLSATEWATDDWDDQGFDVGQAAKLATMLTEAGCDLIDVSTSGNVPAEIPVAPGYQVPMARELTAAGVTTGAVGLITEGHQAEQLLVMGDAEVVFIGRAALRHPAWPLRAAYDVGSARADAPCPQQYARGAVRATHRTGPHPAAHAAGSTACADRQIVPGKGQLDLARSQA